MVNCIIGCKKLGTCQGACYCSLEPELFSPFLTYLQLALIPPSPSYIFLENPRVTDLCNSVMMVQRLLMATPSLIANDGSDPVSANKQLWKEVMMHLPSARLQTLSQRQPSTG